MANDLKNSIYMTCSYNSLWDVGCCWCFFFLQLYRLLWIVTRMRISRRGRSLYNMLVKTTQYGVCTTHSSETAYLPERLSACLACTSVSAELCLSVCLSILSYKQQDKESHGTVFIHTRTSRHHYGDRYSDLCCKG